MQTHHEPKKLWFKRKKYGWGWTPSTWQGWTVTIGYVLLLSCYPLFVQDENSFLLTVFFVVVALLTAGLIAICFLKGEKPTWSWGDEEK